MSQSELLDQVRTLQRLPRPATARAVRLAAGLTVEQVAAELGVHRVTVERWERGERRPRRAVALRYVELLDQLREATR